MIRFFSACFSSGLHLLLRPHRASTDAEKKKHFSIQVMYIMGYAGLQSTRLQPSRRQPSLHEHHAQLIRAQRQI